MPFAFALFGGCAKRAARCAICAPRREVSRETSARNFEEKGAVEYSLSKSYVFRGSRSLCGFGSGDSRLSPGALHPDVVHHCHDDRRPTMTSKTHPMMMGFPVIKENSTHARKKRK